MSEREPQSFLVDRNVGRLVKWLRAVGVDAEFADDGDDSELVRRTMREARAIVTKDRKLLERRVIVRGQVPAVAITADHIKEQLREFFAVVPFRHHTHFSRCIRCNTLLQPISRLDVQGAVPAFVFDHYDDFARCSCCGRIYWQGSHWEHMKSVLKEAVTGASVK